MTDEKTTVVFEESDLGGLTVDDIFCTDCIEGFCPARTPSVLESREFILCGAKKLSQPVIAAYQERTGIELHIERPC